MLRLLLAVIISFVCVVTLMPATIKLLKERGVTGTDVHKPERPDIPKGGGFILLFAMVTGLLIIIGITTFIEEGLVNPALLAALVSILMAGMIGLLDDNLDFGNRTKILLPMLAAVPMMAMNVGTTTMHVPFIGVLDLGPIYPLIIIPLMMTFIIDSTNMYGGMNGLEAGLTSVNASAVVLYLVLQSFMTGQVLDQVETGIVMAALLGASLGFFWFNRFPAKILPGDVGRLAMGAAMGAALILGNMDRLAIVLYIPFGLNFILYLFYRLHVKRTGIEYAKFASPREDGTLEVVGPYTMYWVLPHFSAKMTESRNVKLLILLQAVLAYGAILTILVAQFMGISLV